MTESPDGDLPPDESPRPIPWATNLAIAISVGLFAFGNGALVADAWDVYDGAYWSLVTSSFHHVGIVHLAFNLYWLWVLGRCFERSAGTGRFLLFFLAASWVSAAAELAVSDQTGVGLSGVGYALFGAMWVARREVAAFRDVVDERVVVLFVAWLLGCLLFTAIEAVRIANAAHFGGLLFGAAIGSCVVPRARRSAIAGVLLLVIGSTASLFYAPWSATWQGLRGWRADLAGDLDCALEAYTCAIGLAPEDPWPRDGRGWIRSRREEYDDAIRDFTRAIELDPHYARAFAGRGYARWKTNDLDGALADLGWSIQFDPRQPWIHDERGWIRIEKADYEKAIEDFSRAIDLDAEHLNSYRGRGQARRLAEDHEGAIADLTRAIELEPADSWSYFERASAYWELDRYPAAIKDYTRTIELEPDHADAHTGRALALISLGDTEGAFDDFLRALELGPDDDEFLQALALDLFVAGAHLPAFAEVVRRAVELGYGDPGYLHYLARLLVTSPDPKVRDHESGLALARRAVAEGPQSMEYQNTLGVALYRNELWEEARVALQRSLDLGSEDPGNLYFLAMALHQLDLPEDARCAFEQAVAKTGADRLADEELQRLRAEAEGLLGISGD